MTPERQVSPKFFPFEFTPLYVGMPSVADYTKPTALGGGFVEPVGFNTLAPRRKVVSKTGNEVRAPKVLGGQLSAEQAACAPWQTACLAEACQQMFHTCHCGDRDF